jgi:hypothetical protein
MKTDRHAAEDNKRMVVNLQNAKATMPLPVLSPARFSGRTPHGVALERVSSGGHAHVRGPTFFEMVAIPGPQ